MAKFNLDYYSGENFYSDGDIEKEILKIVKTQGNYESMENVPFPVLYHLSRVRENILNWYPFQEDATCLEIGSGCGAISERTSTWQGMSVCRIWRSGSAI